MESQRRRFIPSFVKNSAPISSIILSRPLFICDFYPLDYWGKFIVAIAYSVMFVAQLKCQAYQSIIRLSTIAIIR